MLDLRYLWLPYCMDGKIKLDLGDLVNLELLGFISTKHCSVTDLLCMTRLRDLTVYFNGGCTSETLCSSLRGLRNLQSFALVDMNESQNDLDFFGGDLVLDFINLKELQLVMHLPRFPDQFQFPRHIAKIYLSDCRMEEDPMLILEKLLHLKTVELSDSAFTGRRMECSKSGFPQLCNLEISQQTELEEWIVEEGSMPCLAALKLSKCKKFKELPDGLNYIPSLKELKIEEMNREWKTKLVPGGEHCYKVRHIPDVQFIKCDEE